MNKISIKFIAKSAIIAALYAALTWVLAPISYGPIQFRLSEVLILIAVFNPKYIPSLVLGCFLANTTSSLGWYDMVFGTLATLIALIPMIWVKKLPIASIFPVISNALIVSIELGFAFDMFAPEVFFYNVLTVGFGEAVVLFLVGIPLWIGITKNSSLVELLELEVKESKLFKKFRMSDSISIALGVIGIILFIAYPLYQVFSEDGSYTNTTMLTFVKEGDLIPLITILLSVLYVVTLILLKNKVRLISAIIIALLYFLPLSLLAIEYNYILQCPYYFGYVIYIALLIIYAIFDYVRNKSTKINEISNDDISNKEEVLD